MVAVICSICGEPAKAEDRECSVCKAVDMRAVPVDQLPETPEERLIANAHRTVEKIDELHRARADQLDEDAEARLARALRARAERQVDVIEARIHHAQELRDTKVYEDTLARLKRELQALL